MKDVLAVIGLVWVAIWVAFVIICLVSHFVPLPPGRRKGAL